MAVARYSVLVDTENTFARALSPPIGRGRTPWPVDPMSCSSSFRWCRDHGMHLIAFLAPGIPMKRLLFTAITASFGMMAVLPLSGFAATDSKIIRASGTVPNACSVIGDNAISLSLASDGKSLGYSGTGTEVRLSSAGSATFSVSTLGIEKPASAGQTVVKGFITVQDSTVDSSNNPLYLASVSSNITIPTGSSASQDYTLPASLSPSVTANIYTDNGSVLPAGTYTASTTLTCLAN